MGLMEFYEQTWNVMNYESGGEKGIRTLDTLLAYTRFPGVLLQPLGHLSPELAILKDLR